MLSGQNIKVRSTPGSTLAVSVYALIEGFTFAFTQIRMIQYKDCEAMSLLTDIHVWGYSQRHIRRRRASCMQVFTWLLANERRYFVASELKLEGSFCDWTVYVS